MVNQKNDTSDRELRISRVLDAPVELVWEVWTQPDHIAQWWGPNGFTNTIDLLEVRPGGEWHMVMHGPDGTDYVTRAVFKEVVPFKRIVYEFLSGTKFEATITFEARGEQTSLTWHALWETAEQFIHMVKVFKGEKGLPQTIEKLNRYLIEQVKNK
jgi:uncharacterized protein YndB with AHSA1/START domain